MEGDTHEPLNPSGNYKEQDVAIIMKQVLSCLCYLHQMNFIHRDLKPEAFVLEKGKELDKIKLIDLATAVKADPDQMLTEKLSKNRSSACAAPELINRNYNAKCDIWAAAVMGYTLLSGKKPFTGKR